MKKNLIVIALVIFCFSSFSFAVEAVKEVKEDEVVNSVCPVMGGEVDNNSAKLEYDGKVIGFCCTDCIDEFKTDPSKYMAKITEELEEEVTVIEPTE